MKDFSDIGAEISSLMEEIDGKISPPQQKVVEEPDTKTSLEESMARVQDRKDNLFKEDYSYIDGLAESITDLDDSGFHNNNQVTIDSNVDLTSRYISAIKRDEDTDNVNIDPYYEQKFAALTRQIMSVSNTVNTISENTLVSGIGHGPFGQAPGGGAARLVDQDDVLIDADSLVGGEVLIWNGHAWVPGSGDARPPIIGDIPPTEHPDFVDPDNNLIKGDHWIDDNGSLHIYYDNQWNKVSVYSDQVLPTDDAPYNIETPNGETFNNQQEYNEWLYTRTDRKPILSSSAPSIHPDFPADPLRVGDYWIDSNNHLYYWDGSAWTLIDAGSGRSPIFDANPPVEHPDYIAPENNLEVGDTWYDIDNGFKQYIWDGTQWVAIAPDRVEAFTRFYEAVDPSSYNSGNDGTCALTATGTTIDTITNVKVAGTDKQSKVRYAYAAGQSIVIEDDRNGAYAVLNVTAVNGIGDYDVVLIASNGTGNLTLGQNYSFGDLTDSKVQISDNPPATALEGDLWWNSDDDELTLYVYYGSNWVPAAPPVSLDGVNTTIAVALEVQEQILERLDDGEVTQTSLQDTVTTALDVQSTLENRVQALEGTVVDGVWKYGSRAWPQNAGEFDIVDASTNKTTVWQDATTLRLFNTDVNGKVYTFTEVNVSDFIRIGAPGSSAVYRAVSAARPQGDYTEFLVEIVTHEDQAYEGILNYNFEFLPAFDATAYATISYVDQQDNDIKDTIDNDCIKNSGTQVLSSSIWKLQQPDEDSVNRNYIEIENNNMKLFHVQDPTDGANEWAANKGYVDTIGNKKVSKTGTSTVSGDIVFTPSSGYSAFKMRLNGENTLKLWNSAGESRLHVEPGKVFKLTSNVNGSDAQTVKVFESGKIRISNHLLPLESSDVANRQYVDDAIAAALTRSTNPDPTPSPFSWKRENKTSGTPSEGCWFLDSNEQFAYFSTTPLEAITIDTSSAIDGTNANDFDGAGVMASFWQKLSDGHFRLIQTCEFTRWRGAYSSGSNGKVLFQLEIARKKLNWSNVPFDEVTYISIPSFF